MPLPPPPSPSQPAVGFRAAPAVLRRRRVDHFGAVLRRRRVAHVGISRGRWASAEHGVARKWSSPPFSPLPRRFSKPNMAPDISTATLSGYFGAFTPARGLVQNRSGSKEHHDTTVETPPRLGPERQDRLCHPRMIFLAGFVSEARVRLARHCAPRKRPCVDLLHLLGVSCRLFAFPLIPTLQIPQLI